MRKKNLYTKYVRCTRDCAMQVHETVQDRFTRKGSHDRASVHRLKKKKKRKKRWIKERKPAFSSI